MSLPYDKMNERIIEDFIKDLDASTEDDYEKAIGAIWKPENVRKKEYRDKWQKDLYREWDKVQKESHDPVQRLRKEMNEQFVELRDAIRKLGILLDSEAPTEEQLKKHKMLRDAYKKYKMIEALILGQEAK